MIGESYHAEQKLKHMTARSSFIILTDAGQLVNEKKKKKKELCLVFGIVASLLFVGFTPSTYYRMAEYILSRFVPFHAACGTLE